MDHKAVRANHKRANKQRSNNTTTTKKKATLKVVYITNPIKFTVTASEFRDLVQELTGQDSNVVPPPEVSKAEELDRNYADRRAEEEVTKEGQSGLCDDDNGNDDRGVDSLEGLMDSSSFWNEGDHDLYDECIDAIL